MRSARWVLVLAVTGGPAFLACGKGALEPVPGDGNSILPDAGTSPVPDGGTVGAPGSDAGSADAGYGEGADAGFDGGTSDGGSGQSGDADAGTGDGGTDGGASDGGRSWTPPPPIDFPAAQDWTFYGPQNGGPHDVFQVSADEGGNVWVAGGEDGLFLLRPGATAFERFTMSDGLRPYGYLPDGSDPIGPKFLKVISVAGGPAGTVYVGYEGLDGCEGAWDKAENRPTPTNPGLAYVYKSGDADKVTLTPAGIDVAHYDIFSGPGLVKAEMEGREKLCTIYRIVYDGGRGNLWFGGNHGFAWGDPDHTAHPACNGAPACSGVVEHSHPAFNGCSGETVCGSWQWVTDTYRGIAPAPDGDVWFGGADRTTKFHWSAFGGAQRDRFISAAELTEWTVPGPTCPRNAYPCYIRNRIDIWPDLWGENDIRPPLKSERTPLDGVYGIAAMPDDSVYVGGIQGLRHLDPYGTLISDETSRLLLPKVGAVARDPFDGTVWVGNLYGGGVARLRGAATDRYAGNVFGNKLANMGIEDIQFAVNGRTRKVLVAFRASASTAGFIAVYSGN
jgi:hypothetical protein